MNFGFLIYPGVEEMDFQGPWEIVGLWHTYSQGPKPLLVAATTDPVACAHGMRVLPDADYASAPPLHALLVPGLAGIVRIAAGNNYSCALDGGGELWCWGESTDGQLGDGGRPATGSTEIRSPTPFLVASGITNVELGYAMTCVETAGGWSCLGRRSSGQLGNGTTVQPVSPEAPFSQAMLGRSAGDGFTVRGVSYRIDRVG